MSDEPQSAESHGTGIKTFPPLVFFIALLAAFGLSWLVPVELMPDSAQRWIGVALAAGGFGLALIAAWSFYRHRTTIHVGHAASTLMTSGPYAFSRNPIYLAMIIVSLGIGVFFDVIWVLPMLVLAVWYLRRNVIDLEEIFLEAKFGDDYIAYKQRVRRWM